MAALLLVPHFVHFWEGAFVDEEVELELAYHLRRHALSDLALVPLGCFFEFSTQIDDLFAKIPGFNNHVRLFSWLRFDSELGCNLRMTNSNPQSFSWLWHQSIFDFYYNRRTTNSPHRWKWHICYNTPQQNYLFIFDGEWWFLSLFLVIFRRKG